MAKMCFFQIAPTTLLFEYSNLLIGINNNMILNVSLKKMTISYPLGMPNIELFLATKMPHATAVATIPSPLPLPEL
jgi:hypothetical protein